MRILITGGLGYVGAHIALEFLDAGHEVTIIDRNANPVTRTASFETIAVDLRDSDRIKLELLNRRFDTVIHCAALTSLPMSLSDPVGFFTNNVTGTLNLLAALKDSGPLRFILSSTAAVYAQSSSVFVSENSLVAPETPYGESKRQCEEVLRFVSDVGNIGVTVLRYFNVAGADSELRAGPNIGQAAALIPSLCHAFIEKKEFRVHGDTHKTPDGTAVRDFIHVTDLARIHLGIATSDKVGLERYQVYNVGYGVGYSVAEVVSAAEHVIGRPVKKIMEMKRPGDLSSVVADPQKLFGTLGPISSVGRLEAMISSCAMWMSKFNGLPVRSFPS